jgi:hypothetical protein
MLLSFSFKTYFLTNIRRKANEACNISGEEPHDHLPDIGKTTSTPKGSQKEIDDLLLTRYLAGAASLGARCFKEARLEMIGRWEKTS